MSDAPAPGEGSASDEPDGEANRTRARPSTLRVPAIRGYADLVEIGRGGYAIVYRAEQEVLHRTVALKVVSGGDIDPTRIRRFERECAAIGSLSGHPHVVSVFDAGTTDAGMPFLSMEFLLRGSLGDRLRTSGPIPVDDAVEIGVQLCGALEAAHQRDVLHRDIKPENVLVGEQGQCKLADFGIAVISDATQHTATGTMVGTVKHSAPELLGGDRATVASDVYSLGSTLFTLLTGTAPFWRAGDESAMPNMLRATRDPLPDLRRVGVPDAVATVIEVACEKDPARRFRSAAAFGSALQQVQGSLGDAVTPMDTREVPAVAAAPAVGVAARLRPDPPPPPPVVAPDVVPSGPPLGPPASSRKLVIGLGVAFVGLVVLIGALVMAARDGNQRLTANDPSSTTGEPPASDSSSSSVPSTSAPPTSAPSTSAPSTSAPSTSAPPTSAPPTSPPSTPSTVAPTTNPPPSSTPSTEPVGTGGAGADQAAATAMAAFPAFVITDNSFWRGRNGVSVLVGEDGEGREKVFVFIDGALAGSDYNEPSYSLAVSDVDADSFVISYDLYGADEDDSCCDPIGVLRTTFTRSGTGMDPDRRSATTDRTVEGHR